MALTDITSRKAVEDQLANLVRSKDEFLASVSHELRTPLTSVIGFAELLRDADSDLAAGDRHEMVNLIAEQGGDLVNIVEDLLIAARAETGDLTVSRVSVNLRAQIAQVLHGATQHPRVEPRRAVVGEHPHTSGPQLVEMSQPLAGPSCRHTSGREYVDQAHGPAPLGDGRERPGEEDLRAA